VTTQLKALFATTERALGAAENFLSVARARLIASVASDGVVEPQRFMAEQFASHAFAWMASYVEALRQIRNWAVRLDEAGMFGEIEALILEVAYGEYLAQLAGGIPMAQGEFARPQDLGLADSDIAPRAGEAGRCRRG
jgi:(2S)-methylsuccinyl-CoA dehydrogenase